MSAAETTGPVSAPVHRFVLLTDICGSSRLAETHPRDYAAALDQHNRMVEQAVVEGGGWIYKNTGDGYFAFFETARALTAAALELDQRLRQAGPQVSGEPLRLRLALHAGELRRSGAEFFGPALNRASRICQVCNPGQLLCSSAVASVLAGQAAEGWRLLDLGRHYLRDLSEPEQLFQLVDAVRGHEDFPPLATLNNRPNNLLQQPNAFIGRTRELSALASLFASGKRLVTIASPGGYGKSRLAVQLCANLLPRFANGVFFAELATVSDSMQIIYQIARATGFQFSGGQNPEEQLLAFLRQKEMLLCCDNFEHVLAGASFIGQLLKQAPDVRLLCTSREPLRISGEHVFSLPPLGLEDAPAGSEATQLFADRAELVSPEFCLSPDNQELVDQVCRRLEGVPLAIELAAAWVETYTLTELLLALTRQLDLTARLVDLPERHRSVRASLDWSWNLLSEEQHRQLMRLSTFHGGFFVTAAEAVLGLEGLPLRTALAALGDKSWLYSHPLHGQMRFRIRDIASHEYAFKKLAESDLYEPAVVAHAAYFAAMLRSLGPRLAGDGGLSGQQDALTQIRTDRENIEEGLDTLLARSDDPAALRLLEPYAEHLKSFLDMSGAARKLGELYAPLAAAARAGGDMRLELQAMLGLSMASLRVGDHEAAREAAGAAEALATSLQDQGGLASALNHQGSLAYTQGDYAQAGELHERSLALRRALGDEHGEAISLHNLASLEHMLGRPRDAAALYKEALRLRRKIGDRHGEASTLNNLSLIELNNDNLPAVVKHCTEALALFRELSDRRGEAAALGNLGIAQNKLGERNLARELITQSLNLRQEAGDRAGVATSLNNLASIELELGHFDKAGELLTQSLDLFRELGARRGEALTLLDLSTVLVSQSQQSEAAMHLAAALQTLLALGDGPNLYRGLVNSAVLLAVAQQPEAAATCLYGAEHLEEKLGLKHEEPLKERAACRAAFENPQSGLSETRRRQLAARASELSPAELAEFAVAELGRLAPASGRADTAQGLGAKGEA